MRGDNSFVIKINENHPLFINTVSNDTNYHWQTNKGILCYTWNQRYFNHDKINNPFHQIKTDTYNGIIGKYDQHSGILPVNGTMSVNGLLGFKYPILRNEKSSCPAMRKTLLWKASVRTKIWLAGMSLLFNYRPQTLRVTLLVTVSLCLFIDRSMPEIIDIWMTRDGIYTNI